ncbi:uncharacterized protein C8Q71DRAFT_533186 [Rhodofomes roseus]|uniref:Uncharacterized protein n=1 Tax=Rhodofomes roseus TaxID=34475 RepID=A0ABQ8KKL2_9APHY|nr:uncharacterized protein C8Q71DRAFT_533186 [Rhodofomes roseus]KAH9838499.1 hypothetical protein C8Q71DRAFT_533186 [Rhodofomes roseus]
MLLTPLVLLVILCFGAVIDPPRIIIFKTSRHIPALQRDVRRLFEIAERCVVFLYRALSGEGLNSESRSRALHTTALLPSKEVVSVVCLRETSALPTLPEPTETALVADDLECHCQMTDPEPPAGVQYVLGFLDRIVHDRTLMFIMTVLFVSYLWRWSTGSLKSRLRRLVLRQQR